MIILTLFIHSLKAFKIILHSSKLAEPRILGSDLVDRENRGNSGLTVMTFSWKGEVYYLRGEGQGKIMQNRNGEKDIKTGKR